MAGGYSSDDSYEQITPKQSRSLRKDQRNTPNNPSPNTPSSGKHTKDKNSPGTDTFSIPEILCECQQKCTERVTAPLIQKVCMYFKALPNRNRQYVYLSKVIQIKVKQITGDEKTTKGKPFRKMGYRYFVPILTDDDMKRQINERKLEEEKLKVTDQKEKQGTANESVCPENFEEKVSDDSVNKDDFPDWDHIEVCLNAFTAIHIISEKRVTITRATQKLQTVMKCSKPFMSYTHALAGAGTYTANSLHAPIKKKLRLEDTMSEENGKKCSSETDICRLAAEWLAKQAAEADKPSFAINPKTLLPEGLVLPASVTCQPIFPRDSTHGHVVRDHNRDIDIVSNFFAHQLWKPEYIGGVP